MIKYTCLMDIYHWKRRFSPVLEFSSLVLELKIDWLCSYLVKDGKLQETIVWAANGFWSHGFITASPDTACKICIQYLAYATDIIKIQKALFRQGTKDTLYFWAH